MDYELSLLNKLRVGDIIHANSPNCPSLICLVTNVSDSHLFTRNITMQFEIKFDIQTGKGNRGAKNDICTIDSIAPLPLDIHNIMLRLDRLFRLLPEKRDHTHLSADEKNAIIFIDNFYRKNPLVSN